MRSGATPVRVKLHVHVQIYVVSPFRHSAGITPTSADISRRYKEAICADERVVALGHGKIDLFRVMCLSNPVVIRSTRLGSLCITQHTSDTRRYVIHNARHKSQMSHNALCNYYPTWTSRVIVFRLRYCLTISFSLGPCRQTQHFNANVSASLSVGLRSISIAKQPTKWWYPSERDILYSIYYYTTPQQRMHFKLQMYSTIQERFFLHIIKIAIYTYV